MLDKKPNCSTTVPVSIFAPHSVKSLEMEEMGMRKKMRLRNEDPCYRWREVAESGSVYLSLLEMMRNC